MSKIIMGEDGAFHCATCEPEAVEGAVQPRTHEATTVYRAPGSAPECVCTVPAGSPHEVTCPANWRAVRITFQDGVRRDGRVSREDWERLLEGKLQSFTLDVTEPHDKHKRLAVIRWWCCRSVEEME